MIHKGGNVLETVQSVAGNLLPTGGKRRSRKVSKSRKVKKSKKSRKVKKSKKSKKSRKSRKH